MDFYPAHFFWHITTASLFLMVLFTLIIAIRTKLSAFYWYFIYSFFLLVYVQFSSSYESSFNLNSIIPNSIYPVLHWFIQVIYNCAYFYFFIHLLKTDKHLPQFSRWLRILIKSVFVTSIFMALLSLSIKNESIYVNYFSLGFTPFTSVLGLVCLYKLWKIPGHLKIIFFIGGLAYLVFALTALLLSKLEANALYNEKNLAPIVYFYIGIIIEQIAFGFALAYFIEQVNKKYHKTISQNLNLKSKHNKELEDKLRQQSEVLKSMALEAKEKEVALLKSKYESKLHESQLSSLQSKMNPHFIFNALNSIKAYLIENDKRKAINYMNHFSKLVRKILESSRIEIISLEEELEIIELYIQIENTRFNNSIQFILEKKTDKMNDIFLPPLILQPFVENALWHGLAPSKNPKQLSLTVSNSNDFIQIQLEDNGVGRDFNLRKNKNTNFKKKSMGICMTQERLDVFNEKFNTAYQFKITDKTHSETGTTVYIDLKKFKNCTAIN